MPNIITGGQLAASSATLQTGGGTVSLHLHNTHTSSLAVVVTAAPAGGTARTLFSRTLETGEAALISGVPLGGSDLLAGYAATASKIDYLILSCPDGVEPSIKVFDASGALKQSHGVASTATNLTISGEFERAAGSVDNTQQNKARIHEDFFADAAATLPTPWGIHDTSTAGTPVTTYVADALNGEFNLAHDTQSEQQNIALYWADQLMIDPTKNPVVEFRMKINFAGAAFTADQRIVIGLASARNATLDSNATHAWFRIEGANLNILWETDDGSADDDDNDSGLDIVDNTWTTFRIDLSDLADIKFYVDGARCAGTAAATFTASHKMQPYIEMQRDAGAEAESVHIDYVTVEWDRV